MAQGAGGLEGPRDLGSLGPGAFGSRGLGVYGSRVLGVLRCSVHPWRSELQIRSTGHGQEVLQRCSAFQGGRLAGRGRSSLFEALSTADTPSHVERLSSPRGPAAMQLRSV